jgi:ribose-phosphate pyrophosphokinase
MSDRFFELFITPEMFDRTKLRELAGPNGWLLFVACNAGIEMARQVKGQYESLLAEKGSHLGEVPLLGTEEQSITRVFDDTESCPRLDLHVAGSDAFVFQCAHEKVSGRSVNENVQQLLQVCRTLRAHRAKTITVVLPYMPYSRQDKPTFLKREATLASLFADQLRVAGVDVVLTYHPHTMALDGFYEPAMKFVALSGIDLFIQIFEPFRGKKEVIAVSTDAGGAKFTVHFANAMGITYAITSKFRDHQGKADLLGVVGDIEGKRVALVTDDEAVTGSSILKTVETLHDRYGIEETHAAISHAKLDEERLKGFVRAHEKCGLETLHVTDTVPQRPPFGELDFVVTHRLARRFATTINRLHYNQSVSELFYKL